MRHPLLLLLNCNDPGPESGSGLLLEDGASFLLLEDGASFLLLES